MLGLIFTATTVAMMVASAIEILGAIHKGRKSSPERSRIALRTTLLIDPDGRERWRVSQSVPDIPAWDETLAMIKQAQAAAGTSLQR